MIDILMAVYNGEKFLRTQLDSLFDQTVTDWHLIVGDDASTDSTLSIIAEYEARYPGKITCLTSAVNSGSPKENFFRLVRASKADYLMTCDHDDVWLPNKIELTMDAMQNLERTLGEVPLLVHTDLTVVNENLQPISHSMFESQKLNPEASTLREFLVQNHVTGCTMMINRALADRVKRMPKDAQMHDWWFALVAAAFGGIGFVKLPTVLYRQYGGNQVGAKNVTSAGFLVRRARNRRAVQAAMSATYAQAQAFLEEFSGELSDADRALTEAYAAIPSFGKLGRWKALVSGQYYKYGFARRIGQFLYI